MRSRARRLTDRFRSWWPAIHWPVIAAIAIVAFILGYIGFREHAQAQELEQSTSDRVYLTLQLYAMQSGSLSEGDTPWQLEVARFAAPVTTAAALIAAFAAAFRDQIHEWRLRRERDHVVVCGLGTAGARLVGELLDTGYRVVAIEADTANPAINTVRHAGAAVVAADARNPNTLARARVDRASHLVCLIGPDDANADVAVQAADLVVDRRPPPLLCLARIRDPHFCTLMRSEQLSAAHRSGVLVDFFSIDELGARLLIKEHPPAPSSGPSGAPCALVVGVNDFGQTLVAELARQQHAATEQTETEHTATSVDGSRIAITVIDPDAKRVVDSIRRRYPLIDDAATIVDVNADFDELDPATIADANATVAYVCIDDDSGALRAALLVRQAVADPDVTVVAELNEARGLGRLMDRPDQAGHVVGFNVLDQTMAAGLLVGGTYEVLAQAIHEQWVEDERAQDPDTTKASVCEWDQLDEGFKQSNRAAAARIGTMLEAFDMVIAPLADWEADQLAFTPEQVEGMARIEHELFVEDRIEAGWTRGPRDDEAKTSPSLVAWADLDESDREKNRNTVRNLPTLLASAGYQVVPARR